MKTILALLATWAILILAILIYLLSVLPTYRFFSVAQPMWRLVYILIWGAMAYAMDENLFSLARKHYIIAGIIVGWNLLWYIIDINKAVGCDKDYDLYRCESEYKVCETLWWTYTNDTCYSTIEKMPLPPQ